MTRSRATLPLNVKPSEGRPLFASIAMEISRDIAQGRLKPGERLPGARKLAKQLLVHRNTIAAAYASLAAEGWISMKRGAGTTVAEDLPPLVERPAIGRQPRESIGFPLALATARAGDEPVSPGLVKWDFGTPDVRLIPRRELAQAVRRVLRDPRHRYLDYERYRADPVSPLQRSLATMLRTSRGLTVEPEDVEVTCGSQMAIYLVSLALFSPGDVVVVEEPGYYAAWGVFRGLGCRVIALPVDEQGLRVELLADLAERERVRAVFVTPHHQLPTTVSLSTSRRLALLSLARRRKIAIIEDDFDHEFHYDGRPILPLASDDRQDVVIHIGSLAKIFAPSIRLGYLTGPAPLVRAIRELRQFIDGHGDLVLDAAISDLFDDGEMQRHINRSRKIYAARRDRLADHLRRRLGSALEFSSPSGGLALWARVENGIDVERWSLRARERGLMFRTGSIFSLSRKPLPFLRLGFGRLNDRELDDAVDRLVAALPARRRA